MVGQELNRPPAPVGPAVFAAPSVSIGTASEPATTKIATGTPRRTPRKPVRNLGAHGFGGGAGRGVRGRGAGLGCVGGEGMLSPFYIQTDGQPTAL